MSRYNFIYKFFYFSVISLCSITKIKIKHIGKYAVCSTFVQCRPKLCHLCFKQLLFKHRQLPGKPSYRPHEPHIKGGWFKVTKKVRKEPIPNLWAKRNRPKKFSLLQFAAYFNPHAAKFFNGKVTNQKLMQTIYTKYA